MVGKKEAKFTFQKFPLYSNPCGGTDMIVITKKQEVKKLRLHHVLWFISPQYQYLLPHFQPIDDWKNVWESCSGWINEKAPKKYKGKLRRGIKYSDGNSIVAAVEDLDNRIFAIYGVWG